MKKIKAITAMSCVVFVVALLSLILLTLPSKEESPDAGTETPPPEQDTYLEVIKTLEAEITQLKQGQYENTASYEAQISDLKGELSKLSETLQEMEKEAPIPYKYTIEDGYAVILEYIGEESEVIVPAAIENCPVVKIEQKAFYQKKISRVTLPVTVREIGWFAFWGCSLLREIELPASVESIGYAVFDGCAKTFKILCPSGSYAEKYAKSYGMTYAVK